jgi:serine protease AprX
MKRKILFLCLVCFQFYAFSQQDAWVYLTDKVDVANAIANPITILTQKAIDRKTNHGVVIDSRDVPVNEAYITQLKNATGITVMAKSKWFNAVHVRGSQTDIDNLTALGFVSSIDFADKSLNSARISGSANKFEIEEAQTVFVYGNTQNQVEMINADNLHVSNFTGTGMTVAVLDAGFPNVNTMAGFQRLRDAGNLLNGYDFVDRTSNVYASSVSDHGTKVLSTMSGFVLNQFVGTAPDASYYLFRTEDASSENPVEESYWVEAAERADSLGVDVINTSLGYFDFDNPSYNYTATDMNGNTAFITKGANIAFQKGMLLVNSAGNSGATGVNAPADAAGVLSIAAVDGNGIYASFSSQGSAIQPTQKPDVAARGLGSYVFGINGVIVQNNGTSFSSPIMAGGIACLWQALPNKTNAEIMQLVREAASQFATPDFFLGYGIPDLQLAMTLELDKAQQSIFKIFPNPVQNILQIDFPKNNKSAMLIIYDVLGKQVVKAFIEQDDNQINLEYLPSGIYILKLKGYNQNVNTFKLIKE